MHPRDQLRHGGRPVHHTVMKANRPAQCDNKPQKEPRRAEYEGWRGWAGCGCALVRLRYRGREPAEAPHRERGPHRGRHLALGDRGGDRGAAQVRLGVGIRRKRCERVEVGGEGLCRVEKRPVARTCGRDRASPKKSSPKIALNRRTLYRKSQKIMISSPELASPIKLKLALP